MEENNLVLMPEDMILRKIYVIRNQKVILDKDLADLYGVSTGNLNKAVQRNRKRFPADFMFKLTKEEFDNLIFQFGISSWGGTRKWPNAFTELGVAMLSSVLQSDQAIMVNLQIMRVFTRMRHILESHTEILKTLEKIQSKDIEQDKQILLIFEYLKQLEEDKTQQQLIQQRRKIGFKRENET
ncbi:MAG: ORF6N domain-containing protein [Bacteroidota bacterium]